MTLLRKSCRLLFMLLVVFAITACTDAIGSTPTEFDSNAAIESAPPNSTHESMTTDSPTETHNLVRTRVAITIEAIETLHTILALTPNTPTFTPTPTPMFGRYSNILYSPDGRYVAVKYPEVGHASGVPTLEILTQDGVLLWSIPDVRGVPQTDPHPYLRAYRWSLDSNSLYYYDSFSFDGAYTLFDGFGLKRIDVNTGQITTLISSEGYTAFALSPDDRRLAYIRFDDNPFVVVIRDLITADEEVYPIDSKAEGFEQAGWITWSPFSNGLIYHTLQDGWMGHAIFLDLTSGVQIVYLEYYIEQYHFQEWLSPGTVRYRNIFDDSIYDINIWTGAGAPTLEQ